jgi:hypothetical protein
MSLDGHCDLAMSPAHNPSGNPAFDDDDIRSSVQSARPSDAEQFRQMQVMPQSCKTLGKMTCHLWALLMAGHDVVFGCSVVASSQNSSFFSERQSFRNFLYHSTLASAKLLAFVLALFDCPGFLLCLPAWHQP